MKNEDIIIVAQQPWDISIGSNCKNIAIEFAKHNRVIYVNPPLDRISSIRNKKDSSVQKRLKIIAKEEQGLEKIDENLWTLYPSFIAESINWLPTTGLFQVFNKKNNKDLAGEIQKYSDQLGFKNCVLFNDSLMFGGFFLKELLKPKFNIYYIRDYLLSQPYFKKHGPLLEPALMRKSDLVVANSTYLRDFSKEHNPNSYYVGQGCELELFEDELIKKIPADLSVIPSPKIGYIGFITAKRLDIELITYIAKSKPDWNIVLVGPEDDTFQKSDLHQVQNVHFLGSKPTSDVPAYIKGFDICINPQKVNDHTIGNYPRKIDEYLALGKPTVATATTAMEVFADYTYLSDSPESYVVNIEKAIHENTQELALPRKEFAQGHTWENSVKEIYKAIDASVTK